MKVGVKRARVIVLGAGITLAATGVSGLYSARAAGKAQATAQTARLTMDPSALSIEPGAKVRIGYMPVQVMFTDVKPAEITKEPTYKAKPKYAVIHIGNGPKSAYNLAFDEPADGDWKVYIDKNQNGDLTDDGDGAWGKKVVGSGRTVYGVNNYVLRASWGTATVEKSHENYGIGLYRIDTPNLSKNAFMFREGARSGELTLAGAKHKVLLVENDGDALFNKTVETDKATGKPVGKVAGRPEWLLVDMKDDGKFSTAEGMAFDVRAPFKVGDAVFEAKIANDGSSITIAPTTKVAAELTPPRAKAKPLLASGTAVPDFRAEAWGGGSIQPADYKGKILILDFWATWCGPCQKSMPHIERVYNAVKDKNVAVLAVCVWDDKDSYSKWVPANQSKYSFPLAFDPAGKDNPNSIAIKQFNVSGIPTTYIIGPDGKIADSIVGYQDGDTRVEAALKKLGVEISAEATK
jgi:thiol-disulfide isomerase/thioredoxin